ncbi:MAG: hydrogenase expression/formation protein [Acidobacteria bacterium]|nr:MAG: hydrogenase expression/formation protein [Acidobacteriota bacterium]
MSRGDRFPVGKVPPEVLSRLLASVPTRDERVLVGPKLGEDAAVIDFGDRVLIAKTDPITFAAERIGWYAVHINANDVATMGARPRWFLATLLLPEERTDTQLVESIFHDIIATCERLNVTLCGGHTEITYGLDRPIVVGHMLGEVEKEKLVLASGLRVGDDIILTKGVAIEGTAIIAREKSEALKERLDESCIQRAEAYLTDPGISVVSEALLANDVAEIHAMHDPTEGGLIAGLWELAVSAGVGLAIEGERIPVLPETRAICEAFQIDPLRLIASGALLIATPPEASVRVLAALDEHGVAATIIGRARPASDGIKLRSHGRWIDLHYPSQDEIAKVL